MAFVVLISITSQSAKITGRCGSTYVARGPMSAGQRGDAMYLIVPIIGAITGGLDFSNYYTPLSSKVQSGLAYADAKKQGAVLGWGQFLTVALNFLIIACVLFLAIKGINKLKKEEPPAPAPGPTPEVKLLTEIRDLLRGKKAAP
jgi:large conductance mechanosensitive channel